MLLKTLDERLKNHRQKHLERRRQPLTGTLQNTTVFYKNQHCISFSTYDYLGLAKHPRVIAALTQGAERYGLGSGSSQMISGYAPAHQALEEAFAEFVGRERALLFPTGYMANLGVLSVLAGRKDGVFLDKLSHASLIDAARLCGAQFERYAHGNVAQLATQLASVAHPIKLIVTDTVFSMDGDLAPLPALVAVAKQQQAHLVVDDAHGFGVLGANGKGALEHFALTPADVPVLVCPLGKAIGCFGALVAGSETVIEALVQFARPSFYTTALPPAIACAAHTALQLLSRETWRREKLQALIQFFKQGARDRGLPILPSDTPIQGVLVGDAQKAVALSEGLLAQGFLVIAIRSPTVPLHTERLRISLNTLHEEQQITQLLDCLAQAYENL